MVMKASPIQLDFVWRIGVGFVGGFRRDLGVNVYVLTSVHETLPWLFWLRGLGVGVMTGGLFIYETILAFSTQLPRCDYKLLAFE